MAVKTFNPYAKCEKTVIFARVSTQHQHDEGSSIDAQLETIRDYCKAKGFEPIKEYVLAESSTRGDRKQYHEMLDFVENYKDKVAIVVNCVDCLQRSYKDTLALDVVDTILEENEPANYTDKHEIVRILKAAVENGTNENMAEQHADEVQDMLGQDRVFD